ncbi:hypothetical protein SPRG_06368 [Saprolegnia parasitica CBS 223.65]|uniref:RWD domain-containing protein n=1 Tax=Saprolegnia parasitica (strain CBS 223.65) TaxID=695850 RepID=A0A067CCW0_SAPPC|nr:hypothetical protein SPRG_06368 [Saprolegnia parasitica CBS 223.65]KDO28318.1 hypothetical protein SPRG_06368 [Saprolegnia parasitica CBS 223.65]|eukprot:XP_012201137.1 hypothetical protein SPRG_06368 [Saprolegnia parasitica CBS 223.65]
MADYAEEQMMEVEALESIYMDDFAKIQDAPLTVKVHVVPNQDGENNHVALSLQCTLPETYPEVSPKIDILLEKGLSDRQEKEIRALLEAQIEENLGMAMIYTITEAVREYLVENNREGNDGSEYQEMLRRMESKQKKEDTAAAAAQAILDEENAHTTAKSNEGTPVTVESFNAWKAKFDEEMMIKVTGKVGVSTEKRLTGRQLWASGAAKEDTTTDADDADGMGDDDDDENDEDYVDDGGDDAN